MLSKGPFWSRFALISRGHFLKHHFPTIFLTVSFNADHHHTFSSVRRHNSSAKSTGSAPWKAPFYTPKTGTVFP